MRTYVREVAPALVRLQTAYIYCSASLEVLEQRFKDRGDDYIVPKHLPDIMRRYESWFLSPSFINFPVLRLDSGSLSPQEMVAVAADFIRYQSVKFKESAK
jgi:deoxyadenosine/deoxycytidine kinase